jgi:rare lipoprotein A
MRSRQNNPRRSICVGVAAVILSLGGTTELPGQMVNTKAPEPAKPKIEGVAVWYNVPPNSLAKRRARQDELTAAHNRLPLGTRVRVTHLGNGKNVVVRITDRGITKRGVLIDLCKEAAEKLDMLREGSARVRLEILPDDKLPTSKSAAPW